MPSTGSAWRWTLVLASTLWFPAAVRAQEPPAAPAPAPAPEAAPRRALEEEITVTGSRIRRKDLNTPAPVTVISREQVLSSGTVSIGDFLQGLPEHSGTAVNANVNNGGDGSTRVNLRGLGTPRTLVLVNGRRMVGVGSPQFGDTSVDLNSIPSAAVERIEVLKDGASALYGADAVGGVVNIITRRSFRGTEATAYAGSSTRSDGGVYDMAVTTGVGGDSGSILFNVGFQKADPVWAYARTISGYQQSYNYTTKKLTRSGSSAIPQGDFSLPVVFDADGNVTGCLPGGTAVYDALCATAVTANNNFFVIDNPALGAAGYHPYGASDSYNFQASNYLVTPSQRLSFYSNGSAQLGSVARGYFEASYVNRQSDQKLAPEPFFSFDPVVVTVAPSSQYNPFGLPLDDVRRRLVEFGNRHYSQDIDTIHLVTGVDGTAPTGLGPLSGWFWDASFNYSRSQGVQSFVGSQRGSQIAAAVGPSQGGVCYQNATPDPANPGQYLYTNPIAGCVPLNLFGGPGTITPDQMSALGYTGTTRQFLQMAGVQLNVSGELFTLMADRPVALAAGYEYRRNYGANVPDPVAAAGDSIDLNFKETKGGYYSNEGYAELSIPVVSGQPLAESLEVTAALRVADFSNFGSNTTYKVGARWSPIRDVTVRGTYSTAFRAPSIGELYLGASDNFPSISDPCSGLTGFDATGNPVFSPLPADLAARCGGAANNHDVRSQIRTRNGGLPTLRPEKADIFTVGLVFEPRAVKNLSVTLDYYNLDIRQSISNIGGGVILNGCYTGTSPGFCSLVHRNATGLISFIDDFNTNVGSDKVDGVDLSIRYAYPSPIGRFRLLFDGVYLHKYDRTLGDGTVIKGAGTYDLAALSGGFGVFARTKLTGGVHYDRGPVGAGVNVRYTGSFKECANDAGVNGSDGACYKNENKYPTHTVGAFTTFDAFASYALGSRAGKTTVAVGMQNVFDAAPPIVYNAFTLGTSDWTAYNPMGRFFYVRAQHAF
ncbi:MAG: TonB-dependent receptor [Deltaproteobacteria bacterium]|nr:TonB-dependent receptor [Deltaproteobacteria bacterium]